MTKIRTAEEILKKYTYTELIDDSDLEKIQDAMIEYAKQFIDLAAEELSETYNSESILKLKEMVK